MAKFLNAVLFNPTAGGTTDFTVSAAVQGYQVPNAAGASNGAVYRYRAENATLTEWEIGYGTYNTGTGVLTRTVVLYNSLGTTAKINFTAPPNVGMGMPLATDIFPFVSDTPPSDPADGALWWESDTGILYIFYNDGSSSQWVGIQSQSSIAAVLFTAQSLTRAQQQQARANLGIALKNYIVNGAMMVSQENGSTAGTTSSYYPVDQFYVVNGSGGSFSIQQVASTTPAGSPNRIRFTVTAADAAVGATDYVRIEQPIEGIRYADLLYGSASAKTVILQFGCKGPAGTYCVAFRNATTNRTYIAEYTITAGEANTDVVKSVIVPGDITGTWAKDSSVGVYVSWLLMCGTTFQQVAGSWAAANCLGSSNQFNLMGTNGNVFELFDVGLYEGVAAPGFVVPDFASELQVCKRYWDKSYDYGTAPGTVTINNASIVYDSGSGTVHGAEVRYGVPKRVAPTITFISPFNGASGFWYDAAGTTNYAPITAANGVNGFYAYIATGAVVGRVQGHWTVNSRM